MYITQKYSQNFAKKHQQSMKKRIFSDNYLQLKIEKYRTLLAFFPEAFSLKLEKIRIKERYAIIACALSKQMGSVDRFHIEDPQEEAWFIQATHDECRHYNRMMYAMTNARQLHQEYLAKEEENSVGDQ